MVETIERDKYIYIYIYIYKPDGCTDSGKSHVDAQGERLY